VPKGAWNGHKTHCPHGHEYTPENTYVRRYLAANQRWYVLRQCRACDAANSRRRYAARKAAS
jgi:hypothetical protein